MSAELEALTTAAAAVVIAAADELSTEQTVEPVGVTPEQESTVSPEAIADAVVDIIETRQAEAEEAVEENVWKADLMMQVAAQALLIQEMSSLVKTALELLQTPSSSSVVVEDLPEAALAEPIIPEVVEQEQKPETPQEPEQVPSEPSPQPQARPRLIL